MTNNPARRALVGGASLAALLCLSWPALLGQDTLDGVFALTGVDQAVTRQVKVTETAVEPANRAELQQYRERGSDRRLTSN